MERIFVPFTCGVCHRHSARSFPRSEIQRKLETREVIQLRCAYDDIAWDASPSERMLMMKLLIEHDAIRRLAPGYSLPRPQWMFLN